MDSVGTQRFQDIDAAAPRKHPIEHDRIERTRAAQRVPLFARDRGYGVMPVQSQPLAKGGRCLRIVFDDQDLGHR
jgi:hypothetical protein